MRKQIFKQNKNKGFTLVEILVGVSIFVLVTSTAVGLIMTSIQSQRKAIAIQEAQENGRYLLQFMAKEIRMSQVNTLDGQTQILNIDHSDFGNIIYRITNGQVLRNNQPISSDNIQVDGWFYIDGRSEDDYQQPKVTITLKIERTGQKSEEATSIILQTTTSQRNLDLD